MSPTRFDSHVALAGPSPSRRARSARHRLAALLLVVSTLVPTVVSAVPTSAAAGDRPGDPVLVVTGRGWGHGRGMGQYGALGYAQDHGWTSGQILDHYYGGTTAGPAPAGGPVDPDRVRVDLVHMRDHPTALALADGTLHLMDGAGSTLTRLTGAVRLTPAGPSMELATAPGCQGPWTPQPPLEQAVVRVEAESTATDETGLLQVCDPGGAAGYDVWYEGEVWATSADGSPRTVNLVTVEQYLRGVIPNEVPAGWPEAVLEAQAVAARSYVLAGDHRWSWADTCDTAQCQVYDGRYTTRKGYFRLGTHPRTDAAVAATAGQVRLRDGAAARTEFSSSTGGWTAGGDFPSVRDEGDAVASNPSASWRVEVDLGPIEAAYDRGPIIGVAVLGRNGVGFDGGRVEEVELRFTGGSVHISGDTARRRFGLKSDWFSIGHLTRGGIVQEPIDGQLIDLYVYRAYQALAGRAPTGAEATVARELVEADSRRRLADHLVRRPDFAGRLVDDLYRRALGRPAEPEGRAYWVETMAGGLAYLHLGTLFYGSTEYVNRAGGTNGDFVDALYANILGRAADDGGRRYWVTLLDGGRARPSDVAHAFYVSIESRRDRARDMHRVVHGTDPGASLAERLAERLLMIDDLTLAAELAVDLDLEDP